MDFFDYQNGTLHVEDVSLADIAKTHGTPTYVYSRKNTGTSLAQI